MSNQRSLHLRILYTVHPSLQYMLARSVNPIPVSLVDSTEPRYATTSLKSCLDTICRSSPELVQDTTRDFSVYLLDPLESQSASGLLTNNSAASNPFPDSQTNSVDNRIAVGLGLMSWALLTDEQESPPVAGTLTRLGTGTEALEVVFSLKETTPMPQSSLLHAVNSFHPCLPSTSQSSHLATTTKQKAGRKSKPGLEGKSKKANKADIKSKPSFCADRLLQGSNTYIGPPKRIGRPGGGSSAREAAAVVSNSDGDSSARDRETLLSLLSVLSTQANQNQNRTQHSNANTALFSALSSIDAHSTPGAPTEHPNPALVAALRGLLSSSSHPRPNPSQPNTFSIDHRNTLASLGHPHPPPQTPSHVQAQGSDDDIVILNKENVDPDAFRRRAERAQEEKLDPGSEASASTPTTTPVPPSTPPASQLPTTAAGTTHASLVFSSSVLAANIPFGLSQTESTGPVGRKRTLSDIMDEKERERGSSRRKGSSKRISDPLRHYRPDALPGENGSSEGSGSGLSRGDSSYYDRTVNSNTNEEEEEENEGQRRDPVLRHAHLASASSPIRSTRNPHRNGLRRPYVVPEWARTNTETRPRLSKEKELELQREYEDGCVGEKRTRSGEAFRRRSKKGRAKRAGKGTRERESSDADVDTNTPTSSQVSQSTLTPVSTKRPNQLPHPTSHYLPVFASDIPAFLSSPVRRTSASLTSPLRHVTSLPSFSSPLRPNPSTPSPRQKTSSTAVPQTPPRRPAPRTSLFTPTPKSKAGIPGEGNPLSSPQFGFGFGSPTSMRKGNKDVHMSPIQAVVRGEGIWAGGGWSTGIGIRKREVDRYVNDAETMAKELDNALGDLDADTPPDSLPVASSDFEFEGQQDINEEDQITETDSPIRPQNWLPPSSPPPTSSPLLMPEDGEQLTSESHIGDLDIDADLPCATSDPEYLTDEDGELSSEAHDDDQQVYPTDDFASWFNLNEFGDIFSTSTTISASLDSQSNNTGSNLDMSVLDEVSNHHLYDAGVNPAVVQNGVADFDFTEFWESVKPLIAAHDASNQEAVGSVDGAEEVNAAKLAQEVQTLFSGCLM